MNSFIAITLLAVVGVAIAAPAKYGGHHGGVVPGPAVVHTYPAVAPVVKCGHNLLVSCDPHHQPVPCKAAAHHEGHGYGHHAPAPAPAYHHAPAPHYAPAPAYHAPAEHGGEYRAKHHKKHHKKHHGHKGKSADNVGEAIDSSSETM